MHLGAILFRLTGAIQTSIQGNGMRPPFKRLLLCAWAAIACSGPAFAGDQIWVSDTAGAIGKIEARPNFAWLEVNKEAFTGTVKGMPARDELKEFETAEQLPTIKEQLVIEYYSR